jgi:hypothetical protein
MLAAEPHLRIGTIDGGEETQFTAIGSAARLSDGQVLIAEIGPRRVRLFSPSGEFIRWIGRVGQGPGEYETVREAGLLTGDTVWIYDLTSRAFELFTPGGTRVRTFRPERLQGLLPPRRLWMLSGGQTVGLASTFAPSPSFEPGESIEDLVLTVLDREGRAAREVARTAGSRWTVLARGVPGAPPGPVFSNRFDERWRALPEFAAAGDMILFADPGTFEMRSFGLDGTLRAILRVAEARRPVTTTMVEDYKRRQLEAMAGNPERQAVLNVAAYTFADSLPHFTDPIIERSGTVWLLEYSDPSGDSESPRRMWRVGIERGVEGYLDLPQGLRPLSIERGEILGVVRDDFDVPYVVAYRLIPRP